MNLDRRIPNGDSFPLELESQIDDLCNRFEDALKEGSRRQLRDFLTQVDGRGRDRLLEELLSVLFEADRRSGRSSDLAAIQREFPGDSELILRAFVKSQRAISQDQQLAETIDGLPADHRADLTGEELINARYEIEHEVARGGMGVVYRARHRILDMPAAVKMVLPGASAERFLREARLLASVNSPHVVKIYDFDVLSDQRQLICMEWVEGSDLRARMKEMPDQRIPEHHAVVWMRQTAQGMAEAANVDITHRDLKPSNILIDQNGNARVADFGLARSPHEALAQSNTGQLLGTPHYMSPEQAENPEGTDTRSDIYSFGATFYHALTGKVPFDGPSLFSILFKHKTETLISPRAHCDELSESICQILERCLAKSPNDRFQSFAELVVHLEQLSKTGSHWDDVHDKWLGTHLQHYESRRDDYLHGRFETDEYCFSEGRKLCIVRDNIVDQRVDVIVSSDDSHLTMGGGVSSAIAERAGDEYVAEARAFLPVRPGRVVVTRPGRLPLRFVFHAITIGYGRDSVQLPSRNIIAELINSCFYHADTLAVRSIAFPLLGTGAAGFSREICLDIMFRIIARKLLHGVTCVEQVHIVDMESRRAVLEWYARIQKRRADDGVGTVESLITIATSVASSLDTKVENSVRDAEEETIDVGSEVKEPGATSEEILPDFEPQETVHTWQEDSRVIDLPELEGYELFRFYLPAVKGGGDYCDFFPLPAQRYCVLVGDIVGHAPQGQNVERLRTDTRNSLRETADLAEAIAMVNRNLCDEIQGRLVTLASIVLDLETHNAVVVCAGHTSPILRTSSGVTERLATRDNLPLGIIETAEYDSVSISLAPGESLTLTTDGIDEAMNAAGELYSLTRVEQQIATSDGTPRDIGETLLRDVRQFMGDNPQDNDMCLVCVGRSA